MRNGDDFDDMPASVLIVLFLIAVLVNVWCWMVDVGERIVHWINTRPGGKSDV